MPYREFLSTISAESSKHPAKIFKRTSNEKSAYAKFANCSSHLKLFGKLITNMSLKMYEI
jgi:hypothetical protein